MNKRLPWVLFAAASMAAVAASARPSGWRRWGKRHGPCLGPSTDLLQDGNMPARPFQDVMVLTVAGAITQPNRGPSTPLDVLASKLNLSFGSARTFGLQELQQAPAAAFWAKLEYDAKKHHLSGPPVLDVLARAGATGDSFTVHGVDGYSPSLTVDEARRLNCILATHLDGRPLAVGQLGPLWLVCDPKKDPDYKEKSLSERFERAPWGTFFITVPPAPPAAAAGRSAEAPAAMT